MSIYLIFESLVLKKSFGIRFLPSILNYRTKHYGNERENERFDLILLRSGTKDLLYLFA